MARSCTTVVLAFALLFFVGSPFLGSRMIVHGQREVTLVPTLLPPENPTCESIQTLFQSMQRQCARDSQQFANQVVVYWYKFTSYHGLIAELGSENLEARVTYTLNGEPVIPAAIGQVTRALSTSDVPLELTLYRPLTVQENQVLNITLRLQGNRQAVNQLCSECVALKLKLPRVSCNFNPKSFDSNLGCLRAFSAWRTELQNKGGAGACQDSQLDRQFLERYRNCFVPPSIQYITSRVEGSLGQPARLVCVTRGNPAPSVRWLRKGTLFTNSQGNTIIFDSVSDGDIGKYVCVAEEREFFNRTIRANATLELQGETCERYQEAHAELLRECATPAALVPQQGCGQFLVPFRNRTVTIDHIQVIIRAEGQLPWVQPGEVAAIVNLNITILQTKNKPPMEPARRKRHDTELKTAGNYALLKRGKRQELGEPQEEIVHQRVYQNVLAIVENGYEVTANVTLEPVDVLPGSTLLIKVAEEGPNKPTVCQLRDLGAFPEFRLRGFTLLPCDSPSSNDYDEGFIPTVEPTEVPLLEGNVPPCQQRYNDWIVARQAVPEGNQCVGDDLKFVTQQYSTCFVPPEVTIVPQEAEVIVGETVTVTCDTAGFPSDYSYQWTVDGTVVPDQRDPVFRYAAVSGVHKIKCKVTSSGGETESEDSTVTVLPEGIVPCRDVQSLFTAMQGLCVREGVADRTRVTVDWNQFPMYHNSLRESGAGTLTAQATYYNLEGQSFSTTASGQAYRINCDFSLVNPELEFFEINGQCLRAFQTWWTKLSTRGGAGSCQNYYLDQPFLDRYRKCFVRPTLQYITSPVKALYRQPARLACVASGGPPPTVRWLRNNKPVNNSDRNTIVFDSVTPADTGNYTCIIEERDFFNETVIATASLELQGLACTNLQQTQTRLLEECASDARFQYSESEFGNCWPTFVAQQNTSIYQLQIQLNSEGQPLPWLQSNEAAGSVNLNVTILRLGQQTLRPLRRRDVGSRIVDNQSPANRFKRAESEQPVILHQKVYPNVLVLRQEGQPTLNVTIEPVNVTLNDIIQVDIAEEGSNSAALCNMGIYPDLQLWGHVFAPCNRIMIPNENSESLQNQEESVPPCQQRYSEWLIARRAVPDGDSCVGSDVVTSQFQKCFVPPEVSIRPSEIEDLVIGETITITCKAAGFPSDYSYQWTVDGTVVPDQRDAVFRYAAAVSGIHKIKCKVTSSGGETESEDSTVTVLPEGTKTFVSSIRITGRNFSPELTDPNSAAFRNISTEMKDWYWQAVGNVQGQVSIRVKDAKPGSVITSQNINVQDSVLQDKDLYNSISNNLRTAAQSPSLLGVDPNSVTLLSATTCYSETVTVTDPSSNDVTLTFPSSTGDKHAYSTQRCANNTASAGIPLAVRRCLGSFQTGVSWASPELLDCGLDLSKLAETTVTEGNVAEVAAELQILTSIGDLLTTENITDTATVLDNIANTNGDENVGYAVVVSVDQIMNADDGILYQSQLKDQAPSRIVQALEQFNDRVNLTTNRFRRIERNIGVETFQIGAAQLINSVGFASLEGSEDLEDGLVRSYSDTSFIPNDKVDASIALPQELGSVVAFLKENIPDPTDVEVRLSFIIYQSSRLFQSNQTAPSSNDKRTSINSRVIASRITGFELKNLPNPVVTRYLPIVQNSTNTTVDNIRCVFWDFNAGGGGAWSTEGCDFVGIDNDRVVCECNHLTNFAVLMDIYGGLHSFALDLISKIGIALSITGLVLTLITYLVFKQLRQTRPQHILINLCVALLATLIIFLAGISATSSPVGCTVVAFLLHYFLLAVFMWMAVEAFNMYLAFVKVLGAHVSRFLLKAAILAWGLPLVIAIITLVVDVPSTYPNGQETYRSTSFCWLQGYQLYFGFLLPAGLVLLFNTIVYIMVISKLTCRGRTKGRVADSGKSATKQQLRIAIAVMVLVGLTWIFGFFMISDGRIVFSYLFCIFNSLQGFFIFIFQCVRQKEVQNLWFNSCSIRNVSYLPPLPRLRTLELQWICIESFSWMSLRALPNLESLDLLGNRLRYVKLDTVIQHLPKLRDVDLRFNKLASFSEYELGRPQVTDALINDNPFHCDCDLSWLIVKMACLQTCKGKERQACCSRCSACFLVKSLKMGAHVCSSPSELNKLHLSNVSVKLTGCGVHQPTTEPEAMTVTSTVFLTDDDENQTETENQLQHNETSMPIIPTGSAQTTKTSSLNATGTMKQEDDDKLSILYILTAVMGTILALTVVLCVIGFTIKHKLCCDCRKDVNIGADHSIPVRTAPQTVDHTYDNPEEDLDGVDLTITGESQGTSSTTNHIYSVEEGMDDVRGADTNGRETTASTIDHVYSNEEDLDNGAEATSPTIGQIYSIDDDLDNGTDTTAQTTNCMYAIEEDIGVTAPIRNKLYNTREAITVGTKTTTSQIYSVEEDLDNGTESTALTTNSIYSTDEGLDDGLGAGTDGTTTTSTTANHTDSID
uniref:Uncharacterized protein n=1 Tax=Branchiostoma floridae TaxID=7739 RepID=C3YZ05_BRAFL|eukprot:XP_002598501.1 hypothetical protein BRAFLDRAFT_66878 [Branchiostoma floridae]